MVEKENLLKDEVALYLKEKSRLVAESNGKFVLIHKNTIEGIFESQTDAINVGIKKFGNAPFLVKKIEEIDQSQNYTSNLIQIPLKVD